MAEILLSNVEDSVPDEEISEFLQRYGFPPFTAIERLSGSGNMPSALITFGDLSHEALRLLQERVQNVYWKNHTINVQILTDRPD